MLQVTKVYCENIKVLISDKIAHVAKIFMIDEVCVLPIEDNTYLVWSTRHLVAKCVWCFFSKYVHEKFMQPMS
jgi:hypothetical protein